MSILVAILALSFLIIVHELGHFGAAKLLGVKVLDFSLFMGPKLLSFTKGETTYSLRLIPIGGSVRMEGEEEYSDDNRAFNKKPKWVRAIILAAGSFMNLFMAVVLLLIINLNNGFVTNQIGEIVPGSSADTASVQLMPGDTILEYNNKKVKTPTEIFIYLQDTKGIPSEMKFRRGNDVLSTTITPEIIPEKYYILGFASMEAYGDDWNVIGNIDEQGPAYAAGMRISDRLLTVDGKMPENRAELRRILAAKVNGTNGTTESIPAVDITFQRGSEVLTGSVTPKLEESVESYVIGIGFMPVSRPGFIDSCAYTVYNSVSFSKMVLYSLKWIVTGNVGLNQVSGPVGIVTVIGEVVESSPTFRDSLFELMALVALIGINLGLFNLIPFPALDGSKLLLLAIEAIRRKAIPPEKEMAISFFGLTVLMMVMVLTLFNDIGRIIAK